jgi:hypothetical protein
MNDVKLFDQHLKDDKGNIVGKVAILVGGINSDNPKEFMDNAVSEYVGREGHNQFVEIHLDNPWTRVLVKGINDIPLRQMTDQDSISK